MKNLDWIAARAAQEIVDKTQTYVVKDREGKEDKKDIKAGEVDNLITKGLGVLQENGVYAALLYLYSRSGAVNIAIAKQAREKLLSLLSELVPSTLVSKDASDALKFLTDNVCDDLDRLLLVKQLWEQTLIYARFGAKARGAAEEVKS